MYYGSTKILTKFKLIISIVCIFILLPSVSAEYNWFEGDIKTDGDLYYGGNANQNARISIDPETNYTELLVMIDGIWQKASLEIGSNTLWLDREVGVSRAGHYLITVGSDGHIHTIPNDGFDGQTSNGELKILNAYAYSARTIFQPDNSSSWEGSTMEFTIYSPYHLLADDGYLQIDTVAATEPIRYRIWQGENDSGNLRFDQTYPASQFPALSEVNFIANGYIEFDEDETYFHRIESNANFSLRMDVTNTTPWFASDVSFLREDNLLQTAPWVNNTSYPVGQYLIRNRTIMVSNDSSVQTGSFSSNLDKWMNIASQAAMNFWTKVENLLSFDGNVSIGGDLNVTGNINMDSSNITNILSTVYNISGCVGESLGTLCHDSEHDTLRYVTESGQILQMNQETTLPSKNLEGSSVADGSVVYIIGATGDNPNFRLAKADNLSTSGLIGVVTRACNNNQVCPVVFFGEVHGFDTSSFSPEDHLYLSETEAGNFTTTPPGFPDVPIWVASPIRIHETEGSIFVFPRLDSANGITMNTLGLAGDFIQTDYKIRSLPGNDAIGQNVFAIEMNGTTGIDIPHLVLQPGGTGQASAWVRSGMVVPESVLCLNSTNRTEPSCFATVGGFTWDILDFNTNLTEGADWGITGELEVIKDASIHGSVNVSGNLSVDNNFSVNTDDLFVDSNSGNVGVGTNTPSHKLNVVGDLNVTGTSYLGDVTIDTDNITVNNILPRDNSNILIDGNINVDGDLQISYNDSIDVNFSVDEWGDLHIDERDGYSGWVGIGITDDVKAVLDIKGYSGNGKTLQLRGGDYVTETDASQILFSYGDNSYDDGGLSHSIRTRHSDSTKTNNAIDFWLWDYGVDNNNTLGTKRVMTIDGEGTGRVGIGTATPSQKLEVAGNLNVSSGSLTVNAGNIIAKGGGSGANNFVGGASAGNYLTTGGNNVIIGEPAGFNLGSGSGHVLIGRNAGAHLVADTNTVMLGYNAGYGATGAGQSVAVGYDSLRSSIGAGNTIAIGFRAGQYSNGTGGVYLGRDAGSFEPDDYKLWISSLSNHLIEGDFVNNWLKVYGDLTIEDESEDDATLTFRNSQENWTVGINGSKYTISNDVGFDAGSHLSIGDRGVMAFGEIPATGNELSAFSFHTDSINKGVLGNAGITINQIDDVGDAALNFKVDTENTPFRWTLGIDNEDNDKFKFWNEQVNETLIIEKNGNINITKDLIVTGDLLINDLSINNLSMGIGEVTGNFKVNGNLTMGDDMWTIYSDPNYVDALRIVDSLGNNYLDFRNDTVKPSITIHASILSTGSGSASASNFGFGWLVLNDATAGANNNFAIGRQPLYKLTDGDDNYASGDYSGYNGTTHSRSLYMGNYAGYANNEDDKLFIGNSDTTGRTIIEGDMAAETLNIRANLTVDKSLTIGSLIGTPWASADDFVINTLGSGGMNIIADGDDASIYFGNSTTPTQAWMRYSNLGQKLFISLQAGNQIVLTNDGLGIGTATPTQKLDVNGNTNISGYTQLGDTAPFIKTKSFTGTSPATEGGVTQIVHGLDYSKIVGVNVLVSDDGGVIIGPGLASPIEFEYGWWVDSTYIIIRLHDTNSGNMTNNPLNVLVTYTS